MLLALARRQVDVLPGRLREAQHDESGPAAALVETLAQLAGGIRTSAEFANHLAFLLLDLTDPEFLQVTRAHATAVEAAIADVLAAGYRVGELRRPPDDGQSLPRTVHAAYNGALVTWGMTGSGSPADAVRHQLDQVLTPHRGPSRR